MFNTYTGFQMLKVQPGKKTGVLTISLLCVLMQAVGKALVRVKKGASLEDANVICSRDDLAQLFKAEVLGLFFLCLA